MQVGTVVKSLDFPGMPDTYLVGRVVSHSAMDQTIRCKVLSTVRNGVKVRSRAHFFVTLLPGLHFLDAEFPGRLTIIA